MIHNHEVTGSIPVPATKRKDEETFSVFSSFLFPVIGDRYLILRDFPTLLWGNSMLFSPLNFVILRYQCIICLNKKAYEKEYDMGSFGRDVGQ